MKSLPKIKNVAPKPIVTEIPAEIPTIGHIHDKFLNGEIIGFVTTDGCTIQKYELFTSGSLLCYFKKGSKKRGYALESLHVKGFIKYLTKTDESKEVENNTWKIINKYRKYASQATFSNSFIEKCLALPSTKEMWESDGKKSLYQYGVTTGVAKEGEVVTLEGMKDVFDVAAIREAIKNKTPYNGSRRDFRGYEATPSIEIKEDGTMCGFLALEFKGYGNGHYYLLINDNCFIYYDKD